MLIPKTANVSVSRRDAMKGGAASFLAFMLPSYFHESHGAEKETIMDHLMGYKNGKYVLPDLPYAYDALEPLYDKQTVQIHHDKHHAAYVNKLNAALMKLDEARGKNDFAAVQALSNEVVFNGSGHVLHTLFWHSMKPGGNGGKIPDKLKTALQESFGDADKALMQFAAATKAVEASGWGILAWESMAQKLLILQCEKHQNLTVWGVKPLLVCDVWEHAYYLKFQNERAKWVDNFMQLANWDFAAERLNQAQ
jgi:superoxide dismutase, Fe-Mn family